MLVSGSCLAVVLAQLRRVNRGLEEVRALEALVRRARADGHAALLEQSQAHPWLNEVLYATTRPLAVLALNERLGEVARDCEVGKEIPRAGGRIAITAATALAICEILRGFNEKQHLLCAVASFAAGLIAALAIAQAAGLLKTRSRQEIDAWNALVKELAPILPHVAEDVLAEPPGLPARLRGQI